VISRRRFLEATLALPLAAGLPFWVWVRPARATGARPLVVEAQGEPEPALKLLLEALGGMGRFVKPGARVLIKPNMSFPSPPPQASTTNPKLVAAVIRQCLEAGAREVLVADHPMRSGRLCLEWTGMKEACGGFREVHLLAADREEMYQEVALSGTRVLKSVKILRAALKADVLINLPQMKSHSATTVSLGTKGNMGLIWDRACFHGQLDLNEAIGDLNTRIRAQLTILDGSRVLTAGGPLGPGPVEETRCLIGGTDPVAVDACGVQRVSWYGRVTRPDEIAHLAACGKRGIGEIDPERVELTVRKTPET